MEPNVIVSEITVLVVDDDSIIRKMASIILSKRGYRCELSKNGVEAIQRVTQGRIDAVVIDVEMPEMDGIVLTKKLGKDFPELPVMVMTGCSDEGIRERASHAGAKDFVSKPFNVSDFATRLQKMLLMHQSA